ncbi:unnamed protein product [Brachionus calyciflorus]|uniref:MULE transposase domain-containing protein n=1 Tax=Brachionus calyciflorus TaxID=104777 RepID=A0A814R645_9BILA|nr:unnamed protein product [Brachionus calyciflorus]
MSLIIHRARNSTDEESNMEDNEFNNDEIEDEKDFKYTIPFEKTETKRKRMAIKIGKETFVFKLTTLGDLGCKNNQTHMHDCLSGAEYKCLEIKEFLIQRAINEETPIPKIFCEELDKLVASGLEHQQIAAYINLNKFVLFDLKDSDRIIGFCSPIGFEILKKTKQFHIDGTFKSTPKIYYQTYGIYCWFLNQMFPAVFVLLSEKTGRIYKKKKLNLLKEACFAKDINLNPEKLVTDFELASFNAFKFHFPGIKVVGCQFHFAQCIRRKVDTLGLKIPYASNDDIQFFIKSFIALSMVPLSKIDDGFIILLENKSKLFVKLTTTTNNLLIVNANRGRGRRGSRGQRGGRVGRGRGRGVIGNTEPTSLTVVFQDLTLNIDTIGNDYCKLIENFIIK